MRPQHFLQLSQLEFRTPAIIIRSQRRAVVKPVKNCAMLLTVACVLWSLLGFAQSLVNLAAIQDGSRGEEMDVGSARISFGFHAQM